MARNQHQRALLRASLSGLFMVVAASLGVCQSHRADQKITQAELQIKTLRTSIPITCNSRLGGVAVGPEGNIYISNFISKVWRVKPGGETDLLASNLQGSSGNAVFHADLLQSSFNDNRILRIDSDGAQSVFASTGLNGPIGIAINELDEVFVCNFKNNSLVRIDPDGDLEVLAKGGHLSGPNGIAVGPELLPYVVNYNDAKVMRLTAMDELELFVTLPGAGNAHIAWAQGAFFVTKIGNNQLYRVTLDGEYALFAGTGQPGLDDGDLKACTLNAPNGIATSADGKSLIMNNMKGTWKSKQAAELVLRQIDLQPLAVEPKAELEKGQVKLGELTFDYLAAGPLDGEAVLLLHGFPQTGYSYRAQLSALAQQGYRAVAPDQRGYSAGARPLGIDQYGMSHLVADALGMADALGFEGFHLVGHDWGAAVAWSLAARHPERLNSLTILSTPHYAAFGAQLRDPDSTQSRRSAYMADFAATGAETRMLADDAAGLRAIYGSAGLSEQDIQVYLDALASEAALGSALNWYRAMGSSSPKAGGARPVRPTSKIEVPTLYLFGLQDSAFALDCAESSSNYVSADYRFVPLEGMGHWLPEEASPEVNRELLQHLAQNGERE